MSCTDPTDESGECAAVLHDVWLFLDNELDAERRAIVQRHLDDCSPCLEEAGLDVKLKRLLQTKCGGDKAPERLRERVVAELFQVTGRITVGRAGRRHRQRHVGERRVGAEDPADPTRAPEARSCPGLLRVRTLAVVGR